MIDTDVAFTRWPAWVEGHPHVGRRETIAYGALVDELEACSKLPHCSDGWSPATFKGERRTKANVEQLFAIGLDCDKGERAISDVAALFLGSLGFVHSTKGHTTERPRCRIVLRFARPVTADEYVRIWFFFEALLKEHGIVVDRSTKDPSRFWFKPSAPIAGGPATFIRLEGVPVDPVEVLAVAPTDTPKVASTSAPMTSSSSSGHRRFCEVALEGACRDLLAAPSGARNMTLAARAYAMGGLAGPGRLSVDEVEAAMLRVIAGWDPAYLHEHTRTLSRQVAEGAKAPREIPLLEPRAKTRAAAATSEIADTLELDPPDFRKCTDTGNAERLIDRHGHDLRYCDALGRMVYDGRRFTRARRGEWMQRAIDTVRGIYGEAEKAADSQMRKAIAEWAKSSESVSKLGGMMKIAESHASIAITTDELDANPFLFNVENGTIDLRTGELRPHDRGDHVTKIAGTHYDARARCPVFQAFLASVFEGKADLIAFLQRFVGYCLTGDVREQVLLFAYGSGANGKSTWIDILIRLMGGYAMPAAPGLLIARHGDQHPTELADLHGARLVTCVEIGENRRFDEERVKALTGSDAIKGRFMRADFFSFAPSHKLILAANHRPEVRGTDPAIWRRILLVPFSVAFSGAQRDSAMPEKLRAELPGILRWAVEGCLAWQREGLRPPAIVDAATKSYREDQDQIGRFIAERCFVNAVVSANASLLYRAYVEWVQEGGEHAVAQKKFGTSLRERGFENQHTRTGALWRGVGLQQRDPCDPCDASSGMTAMNSVHEAFNRKTASHPSQPSHLDRGEAAE